MRCFACRKFSVDVICENCRRHFVPAHRTRRLGTLDVHAFFDYDTLEPLLLTKHKPEGWRVYRWLANRIVRPFFETFAGHLTDEIYIIGIDEYPKGGYAHIAVLTHALRRVPNLRVRHGILHAQNRVSYAGKPLQYRLDNPRRFAYRGPKGVEAILIDDIVTTGTTLQEAYATLTRADVDVLFAVTLADAAT